jgi:hypothetical protein
MRVYQSNQAVNCRFQDDGPAVPPALQNQELLALMFRGLQLFFCLKTWQKSTPKQTSARTPMRHERHQEMRGHRLHPFLAVK